MRIRHLSIANALVLVTPALVVFPLTPGAAQPKEPEAVKTAESRVALVDPAAPEVGDGDVITVGEQADARKKVQQASPPAAKVATPHVLEVSTPTAVSSPVAVVGVTWRRGTGPQTAVQYRTRGDAGWGDWQSVDADDAPAEDNPTAAERAGSDPIVVTGAHEVQARVLGEPGGTPVDTRLTVVDPGASDADATAGTTPPGSAEAAAARPVINSRAAWGADESLRRGSPSYSRTRGFIIHHTEGTNSYTPSQVPQILRGIYAFHVKDRGWSDIGYNVLVDKWGRLWQGRAGSIGTSHPVGAHTANFNSQTFGISVMGNHMKVAPTQATIDAIERVVAWKADLNNLDPTGYTTLYGRTFRTVIGHRDAGNTDCPGIYLYPKLGEIRRGAKARMSGSAGGNQGAPTPEPSPTPSPRPTPRPTPPARPALGSLSAADVLVRRTDQSLARVTPTSTTTLAAPQAVSTYSWAGYNAVLAAGDLNRDGRGDLLARVAATGELRLFTGTASGTLDSSRTVARGWGGMSRLSAAGDMTGDRVPDVVAVNRASGRLYVYPGDGNGGLRRAIYAGRGWHAFTHVVGVGDWNRDGRNDLLGVLPDGSARVYYGNGKGGLAGSSLLHGGWKQYARLSGVIGKQLLVGQTPSGVTHVIRRHGATTTRAAAARGAVGGFYYGN